MRQWPASAFETAPPPGRPHAAASDAVEVSIEPVQRLPQELRGEWEALQRDASEPNSFVEWWFVEASLRHLAPAAGVRLAQVRRGGQAIGLALFHSAADYGRATIPHVSVWSHCNQFVGTPLIRRGEERTFWAAMLGALDGAAWAPSFLHLSNVAEGGPVHRGLDAAAGALGRSCSIVHRRSRALLETCLSAGDYLERSLRGKRRSELARRRKRLAEQGELRVRELSGSDELADWCDEFLALERAGWKGRAGSALACNPARTAFFREALAGAFAAGRLHFLRLDLDGRAIAMLNSFLAPPGAFGFKTAYDEAYARYSPGMLLQIDNLAILDRPGISWVDSCSTEDQGMADTLWTERRNVVRLTVRLAGLRRLVPFATACVLDRGPQALRPFQRRKGHTQ